VVKDLVCVFRALDDEVVMIDFTGKVKYHITTNSPLQQEIVLKMIQQTSTKAVSQLYMTGPHFLHQLKFEWSECQSCKTLHTVH
jgi:DNA-binding transcriptional regulator YbjK